MASGSVRAPGSFARMSMTLPMAARSALSTRYRMYSSASRRVGRQMMPTGVQIWTSRPPSRARRRVSLMRSVLASGSLTPSKWRSVERVVGAVEVERTVAGPDSADDLPPFLTLGVAVVVLQHPHAEHLELGLD